MNLVSSFNNTKKSLYKVVICETNAFFITQKNCSKSQLLMLGPK